MIYYTTLIITRTPPTKNGIGNYSGLYVKKAAYKYLFKFRFSGLDDFVREEDRNLQADLGSSSLLFGPGLRMKRTLN